jgi:hypothetical protein
MSRLTCAVVGALLLLAAPAAAELRDLRVRLPIR